MKRHFAAAALSAIVAVAPLAGAAVAASAPTSWDGLTRVSSKKFDYVYLLPGADFRSYTKIMLDPTEVAFQKNWLRDYNNQAGSMSRMSDADAQRLLSEVQKGFQEVFRKAVADAGYTIVDAPGPDVLRVGTAVLNLDVAAPDVMSPGRSRTFSQDAGGASLVVEVRDSSSNALLGRAVDNRVIGYGAPFRRDSVSNRADFERQFGAWAKSSVAGLAELKARSPLAGGATAAATP
jgi:hypothetical protein